MSTTKSCKNVNKIQILHLRKNNPMIILLVSVLIADYFARYDLSFRLSLRHVF
jgi:hypothetical protein